MDIINEQVVKKNATIKKVIIALDYDSNSNLIAKIGHEIAAGMGAQTVLFHVVADESNYIIDSYNPILGMSGFDYNVFSNFIDTSGFIAASTYYLENIKQNLDDEKIQILVEIGGAEQEIVNNAIKINADLIVMGSHSKKWLEKILVGSVAESVLENSKIPVLIIPTKKHE